LYTGSFILRGFAVGLTPSGVRYARHSQVPERSAGNTKASRTSFTSSQDYLQPIYPFFRLASPLESEKEEQVTCGASVQLRPGLLAVPVLYS
jgi:hypothetical protein